MLANSTVMANVAVSDIAKAKEFYGGTLGLSQEDENPGGVMYRCGGGLLFVYQAPSAGKNESTSATWQVEDIDAVVNELKAKGVTFEEYDMPEVTVENSIHAVMEGMKAAWFRDPDGNILGLAYEAQV